MRHRVPQLDPGCIASGFQHVAGAGPRAVPFRDPGDVPREEAQGSRQTPAVALPQFEPTTTGSLGGDGPRWVRLTEGHENARVPRTTFFPVFLRILRA